MYRAFEEQACPAHATAVDARTWVSALRSREGGERAKLFRGVVKCEAERLPEADVAFHLIGQHDEISGHGCAISERRPKSTLA
jgi:hypothetical protein